MVLSVSSLCRPLFLLSLVLFGACGGGGSGATSDDSDNGTALSTGSISFSGVVVDSANSPVPIEGVTVTLGSETVATAADGRFSISDIDAAERAVVTYSKPGYVNATGIVRFFSGVDAVVDVSMARVSVEKDIDASIDNTIADGDNTIFIAANTLVNADGSAFTGTATIKFTAFDPVSNSVFPGEHEGVRSDGSTVPIMSFGFVNVDAEDASGNALNLAPGSMAALSFSVNSSIQSKAPATIPVWYFDEAEGRWKEEGVGTLNGTNYEASIPHFSFWNYDSVYDTSFLSGKVTDCMGESVANATVVFSDYTRTWTTTAYTDANGKFSSVAVEAEAGVYISVRKGGDESLNNYYYSPAAGEEGGVNDILLASICAAGKAAIGHMGYDFSLSTDDNSTEGYIDDGMTNTWGCNDSPTTTGVFWCPSSYTTAAQFKDMGAVELSSIINTPTEFDSPIEALQVNHVYVVSTADGYVKFRVDAIHPDSSMWTVVVEPVYTSGSAFSN